METTRILQGSTIGSIAYHFYGANTSGIDLIKEFNPHYRSEIGFLLTGASEIPSLTKETLQREQPDGSYHVILGVFS